MRELRSNFDSPCYPPFWRCFLCCFLLATGILTVTGFQHYFVIHLFEDGDFAANSLRIANAMSLQEIYGNYSRWEFSHPGPAFFYVYAIGQLIFHYAIGICPQEHNAQLFTGMLFQTAFWSLAICVIYTHAQRWKPVFIIASLSFIHFQLCEQAFISIWPPHQLLMPFLCLLLSSASILAGSRQWLWLLALSACFCVHGHVAQPLFVLPLTAVAIAAVIYWQRETTSSRGPACWNRVRHALWQRDVGTGVLITIPFLIPLFVDWLKFRDSNLARILVHLRSHSEPDHSLTQSLNYYLQFYRYWGFHDAPESDELLDLLTSFPWLFGVWFTAMLLTLAGLALAWKLRTTPLRWLRWTTSLLLIAILAQILTLKWGCMMDGEMFAFNAFINYAVILLNICVFTSVLQCFLNQKTEWLCIVVCCTALLVAITLPIHNDRWISDTGYRPMQGRNLDLRDGKVQLPPDSWIYFQSPNPSRDWILMVGQANAWRKAGLNAFVPDDLSIVFGKERTIHAFINQRAPHPFICIEFASPAAQSSRTSSHDGTFQMTEPAIMTSGRHSISLQELAKLHSGTFIPAESPADNYTQMSSNDTVIVLPINGTPDSLSLELSPPVEDTFWLTLDVGQAKVIHTKIESRTKLDIPLEPEIVKRCIAQYGSLVFRMTLSTQSTPLTLFSKRATIGFRIHEFTLAAN